MQSDDADHRSDHPASGVLLDWTTDWLLASWARQIERVSSEHPDFGLGVTLNVGGATYSGVLVSGRRWAEDMAAMLRMASMDHGMGATLAAGFEAEQRHYQQAGSADRPVHFLYLLHTALVDGRGERTGEGLPMRFRLDAIAAWAIAGWAVGTTGWHPAESAVTS